MSVNGPAEGHLVGKFKQANTHSTTENQLRYPLFKYKPDDPFYARLQTYMTNLFLHVFHQKDYNRNLRKVLVPGIND